MLGLWSCKSLIFNFSILFKQTLVISHGSQQGFLWNTVIPPLPSNSSQFSKALVLTEVVRLGVCLMMDGTGCPGSMTRLPYSGQVSPQTMRPRVLWIYSGMTSSQPISNCPRDKSQEGELHHHHQAEGSRGRIWYFKKMSSFISCSVSLA